jgi:hypothetical protein
LTERGQYVAIHEERVIDRDRDDMALIGRVLAQIGNVDIHVGLVTDQPEPIYRSGVVRDLAPIYTLPVYAVMLGLHDLPVQSFKFAAHAEEAWVLLGRDVLNAHRILLDGPRLALEIG